MPKIYRLLKHTPTLVIPALSFTMPKIYRLLKHSIRCA